MQLGIENQTAVVVGGARGIGLAAARQLLEERAVVVLWDRAAETLEVAEQLSAEFGLNVQGLLVDITQPDQVRQAFERTVDVSGAIDMVVHAAAIGSGQFGFPFLNVDPDKWAAVWEVNVQGMVHVAHQFAPHMMERRQGSFVFLASVAGQIGSPTDPPYSASKAANINFAQCMARDLAQHGIRVNTVCPGMVRTALNESVWQAWNSRQPPADQQTYDEWAESKIQQVIPQGRWQTAEDVANAIVFLCSPRAASITGQTINVDGGCVMHS